MKNRNLKKDLKQLDTILKEQGISRRDVMKMVGIGSIATLMGGTDANASTSIKTSNANGKILIIGGGLSGMSTAARLTNKLSNPDITIIEPNTLSAQYQPGQTLVGSGLWKKQEIIYQRDDFIPQGVKLISEKAVEFDPDNNTVTTDKGTLVRYDYLIVAIGLKLNYAAISGLEEAGEVYSAGDNKKLVEVLNSKNVSSVYTADGAEATWLNMQKLISNAKSGKKQNAIYTHPNTRVKYSEASKEIMYLTNSRLQEADARDKVNMNFYTNDNQMISVKDYDNAIIKQFEERNFKWSYDYNLIAVDGKTATFKYQGKEESNLSKEIKVPYDFIHITPPMKAPDEIGNSKIGSQKGWVPVNKETLQHKKYKNIFALGDIVDISMGKTTESTRQQYKVVVNNVISMMENGKIPSTNKKYTGYTVCPLITNIGTVMLAEFNWKNAPTPTIPIDPTKERYIWWLLKFYLLKPMTVYGMLAGKV